MTDHRGYQGSYRRESSGPVRYYPIVARGETVGYLWAAAADNAASCMRRLALKEESWRAYRVWNDRLKDAWAQDLTPLQALRKWVGEPEGDDYGRLDDGAGELEAPSLDALGELANPGHVDAIEERIRRDPRATSRWRGGPPPPVPVGSPRPTYPKTTDAPVRYLPVTRNGVVLGYLWASVANDAAAYVFRRAIGDDGFNSAMPWIKALRAAFEYGMTPLEALHHAIGTPEDERSGGIPAGTVPSTAESLSALLEIAQN
ncbi:hypothetical protein [Actinomadura sp. NTSP31]|uniref:hypothetical protein n=1 Tax=Actinomadura sp. NTSP31 TaxID=1735447 RepID=UPI0035C1A516